MGKITLITADRIFGRMLELELIAAGHTVTFKSAAESRPASEAAANALKKQTKPQRPEQPLFRASIRQMRRSKESRPVPPELLIQNAAPDVAVIDADTSADALKDSENERIAVFSIDKKKLDSIASASDSGENAAMLRCFLRPFDVTRFIEAVNELCSAADDGASDNSKPSEKLAFDLENSLVYFGGVRIDLTKREYELLCCLYDSRPEPISRGELIKRVWRYDFEGNTNVVDVYIRYLREKLDIPYGVKLVETVRGAGYRLN